MFACVGWKVTLCDPIWQVTLRSCEMDMVPYWYQTHEQLYCSLLYFTLPATIGVYPFANTVMLRTIGRLNNSITKTMTIVVILREIHENGMHNNSEDPRVDLTTN